MPTYTLGDILEQRRLSVGMTLEEAADTTNIRLRVLETFEASDYGHFPTKGHVRGMLSSYARVLGLNSHDILALYEKEFATFSQRQEIAKNAEYARRGVSKFGTKRVQSAKPMMRHASEDIGNTEEEPQVNATSVEDFVADNSVSDSSLSMRNVKVINKRNSINFGGTSRDTLGGGSRDTLGAGSGSSRGASREGLGAGSRDTLGGGSRDYGERPSRSGGTLGGPGDYGERPARSATRDYGERPARSGSTRDYGERPSRKSVLKDDARAGLTDTPRDDSRSSLRSSYRDRSSDRGVRQNNKQQGDFAASDMRESADLQRDDFASSDFSRSKTRNKNTRRRTTTLSGDPYQSLNEKKAKEAEESKAIEAEATDSSSLKSIVDDDKKSSRKHGSRRSKRDADRSASGIDSAKSDSSKKDGSKTAGKDKGGNTLSNAMDVNVEEFSAEQDRAARRRMRKKADEEERERRSALSRQQNFFQIIAGIIVSIFSERRTRLIAVAVIMLVIAISIAAIFLITTAGNQNAGIISPQGEQSQNDVIDTPNESNARATVTTTNGSPIAVSISVAEGSTSLINVTYDDDKAYSGTAVGAWSRTFQVTESMEATFGNPDAVVVTENGQQVQITRQEDGTGRLSLVVQALNAAQTN